MSATSAADDLPVPIEELTAAVKAIEQCLAQIDADPGSGLGFGRETSTLLLLHMSAVEQRLEALAGVNVVTWPDARWALHFCNARERAINATRQPAYSFHPAHGAVTAGGRGRSARYAI